MLSFNFTYPAKIFRYLLWDCCLINFELEFQKQIEQGIDRKQIY